MIKPQPLVALDLGSTKVACAIGLPRQHASGFELMGSSLVPYRSYPETWLADPLTVSHAIEQALEATAVSAEFDRALVAISHPLLTSERVRVGVTLGDEPMTVRAQDLSRLRAAALHQVLGIDREALLIERLGCAGNGFDNVRDPRGLSATRLMGTFHVVTIPMAARRAIVQAVESAGLELARLTYSLPALRAGMTDGTADSQRILLLDMGGLSTHLGLFADGALQAAQILPWGGLTIAGTIARELSMTMEQALTWSLEGTACRKADVRSLVERQWASLGNALRSLLDNQPRPDVTIIGGRGALIDGFAEWLDRLVGMPSVFCRSARTNQQTDLSRQVGVCAAIGMLELQTQTAQSRTVRAPHLFDRVIDRTRTVLTEYF